MMLFMIILLLILMIKLFKNSVILILCLVVVISSKVCLEQPCQTSRSVPSLKQIYKQVDVSIRKQFWYYIRKSDVIYLAVVDTSLDYIFFTVYQNKIGTFLSIASYSFETLNVNVRTMIRMGEGKNQNKEGIKVSPFFMEISVNNQKYLVQMDEHGAVLINKEASSEAAEDATDVVQDAQESVDEVSAKKDQNTLKEDSLKNKEKEETKQKSNEEVDRKQKTDKTVGIVDDYLRNQFWYYIQDAEIIKTQKVQMDLTAYVLLTYNGKFGVFLAVCSYNQQTVKVNSFVRLGGHKKIKQQPEQVQLETVTLEDFGIMPLMIN